MKSPCSTLVRISVIKAIGIIVLRVRRDDRSSFALIRSIFDRDSAAFIRRSPFGRSLSKFAAITADRLLALPPRPIPKSSCQPTKKSDGTDCGEQPASQPSCTSSSLTLSLKVPNEGRKEGPRANERERLRARKKPMHRRRYRRTRSKLVSESFPRGNIIFAPEGTCAGKCGGQHGDLAYLWRVEF